MNGDILYSTFCFSYFPDIRFARVGFSMMEAISQSSLFEVSAVRVTTTELMFGRCCGSFSVHALPSSAICKSENGLSF